MGNQSLEYWLQPARIQSGHWSNGPWRVLHGPLAGAEVLDQDAEDPMLSSQKRSKVSPWTGTRQGFVDLLGSI